MSVEPILSRKKMPSDDVPLQMLTLLVELLRSGELPELAIDGAWFGVNQCLAMRPGLGPAAMELGVIELAADHCRAIGSAADMVSISRGKVGRVYAPLMAAYNVTRLFGSQAERPDLAACVASGLFDICIEAVVAFAAAGVEGLRDTNHCVVVYALTWLAKCGSQPECQAKIRGAATALAFCRSTRWTSWKSLGLRPAPSLPGSAAVSSGETKAALSSRSRRSTSTF